MEIWIFIFHNVGFIHTQKERLFIGGGWMKSVEKEQDHCHQPYTIDIQLYHHSVGQMLLKLTPLQQYPILSKYLQTLSDGLLVLRTFNVSKFLNLTIA